LVQRDLDAAFLADDALVLHALVLAAQALIVLHRTEDPGTEQTVPLGLEGAVVDRLRLLDLAEGPREDPLRASERDLDPSKVGAGCVGIEDVHQFLVHGENSPKSVHFEKGDVGARNPGG
jgi:hypothetical protein